MKTIKIKFHAVNFDTNTITISERRATDYELKQMKPRIKENFTEFNKQKNELSIFYRYDN